MLAKKPPISGGTTRQSRNRQPQAPSKFLRSSSTSSSLTNTSTDGFSLPSITKSSAKNLKRSLSSNSAFKQQEQDETLLRRAQFKSQSAKELDNAARYARVIVKHNNPIRLYDQIPSSSMPALHIVNQAEAKRKFFQMHIPPVLKFAVENSVARKIVARHGLPDFHYFLKAKHILEMVKSKFPEGLSDHYYEAHFGPKVSNKEVIDIIGDYLKNNKIQGNFSVNFAPGQTCSGRISTYTISKSEPETRTFAMWVNNAADNQYIRKKGMNCLLDHEVGTHYFRALNDGFQPWYGNRKKFGLRSENSNELLTTEEGIACIHTVINANSKYLYLPALLYYVACMGKTMTFERLFDHMSQYIRSPEECWKLIMRVKRGISDPNAVGVYARDQSYFEGACKVLENVEKIDFKLLMSGKICLDELDKVKEVARLDLIKLPKFYRNMKKYKEKLRLIAAVNGLGKEEEKDSKAAPQVESNALQKELTSLQMNTQAIIPEEDVAGELNLVT